MSKLALFRADQCRKDHCDNNSKKCGDIVLTNSSLKNNISFVTHLLFEGILKGGVKYASQETRILFWVRRRP